jgi:predicted deacetylase
MKPAALISLHDVMPGTLPAVSRSLALLRAHGIERTALLVVPGASWDAESLDQLRSLAEAGHELVAHGWYHSTRPRRPLHRAHALLLSRNVAEHLALDRAGILALMRRSHDWFARQSLPLPEAYIPPAWALGHLRTGDLESQPFRVLETLRGVRLRQPDGRFVLAPLPLLGFEADTALRAEVLGSWNRLQLRRARRGGQILRIALHPHDERLRLADQLQAVLALGWTPVSYAALAPAPAPLLTP